MQSKTLIVLQNLDTMEYIESLSNESDISWCLEWQDAQDFNDMFFVKRWLLGFKLNHKFGLKLKWKKILIFESVRGLV